MNEETLASDAEPGHDVVKLGLQPLDPVWNVTRQTRTHLEGALAAL
jgi:hypothetical protein